MARAPLSTSVDDGGWPIGGAATTVINAAGTNTLKASPGRLCKVVVTATGTGTVTFYDNPSTGSGTIIGIVPASATVGTSYDFGMPALAGITAVTTATAPTVTVSFS